MSAPVTPSFGEHESHRECDCPAWPASPAAWERVRQVYSNLIGGIGRQYAVWERKPGSPRPVREAAKKGAEG